MKEGVEMSAEENKAVVRRYIEKVWNRRTGGAYSLAEVGVAPGEKALEKKPRMPAAAHAARVERQEVGPLRLRSRGHRYPRQPVARRLLCSASWASRGWHLARLGQRPRRVALDGAHDPRRARPGRPSATAASRSYCPDCRCGGDGGFDRRRPAARARGAVVRGSGADHVGGMDGPLCVAVPGQSVGAPFGRPSAAYGTVRGACGRGAPGRRRDRRCRVLAAVDVVGAVGGVRCRRTPRGSRHALHPGLVPAFGPAPLGPRHEMEERRVGCR